MALAALSVLLLFSKAHNSQVGTVFVLPWALKSLKGKTYQGQSNGGMLRVTALTAGSKRHAASLPPSFQGLLLFTLSVRSQLCSGWGRRFEGAQKVPANPCQSP